MTSLLPNAGELPAWCSAVRMRCRRHARPDRRPGVGWRRSDRLGQGNVRIDQSGSEALRKAEGVEPVNLRKVSLKTDLELKPLSVAMPRIFI